MQEASNTDPYRWVGDSLARIRRVNWYRQVRPIESLAGPVVTVAGRPLLNFASNDYLGLAGDKRLAVAAIAAIETFGTGATGSRLLSGHRPLHRELEAAIAAFKGTEDCIVFSSGYLANIGTLISLVGEGDLILTDEYNHASLKNGATLSGATVITYRHSDLKELEKALTRHRLAHRRALIVSDGVFGMDGDVCPLPAILDLAAAHGAMVLIDEAHSTGVLGDNGAGCSAHFGCEHRPMIQMGTLSKTFASLGGYVTASAEIVDFLRNRAPSWIYTTGLSAADTAAALAALRVLQQEPERVAQLRHKVQYLCDRIDHLLAYLPAHAIPCQRLPTDSAIICLQVKDARTVLHLGQQLEAQGCLVSAVRPPTVPVSRLRLSLMATHTQDHLDRLIESLALCLSASG